MSDTPSSIDEYIAGFAPEVRSILQRIRKTVREAAPDAQEAISYRIPAFRQNGVLVYFAAFKKHIGFYPPVRGDVKLVRPPHATPAKKATCGFLSISRSRTR